MTINFVSKDIFTSDANILCHSVNHQGVMGSGLAKQMVKKYPKIISDSEFYSSKCRIPFQEIKQKGIVAWYKISDIKWIASIFGQDMYGTDKQYTDYVSLGNGLISVASAAQQQSFSIAIPSGIGCGLGGGDWDVVLNIIEDCFKYYPDVNVWICKK